MAQGEPSVYQWGFGRSFVRVIPVVLLLVLQFRRTNRKRDTWLVWIPVLLLAAPSLWFRQHAFAWWNFFGGVPSFERGAILIPATLAVSAFAVGMAALLLASHVLEKKRTLTKAGLSMALLLCYGALTIATDHCFHFSQEAWHTAICYAAAALLFVASFSMAEVCTRRNGSRLRFLWWFFLTNQIVGLLAACLVVPLLHADTYWIGAGGLGAGLLGFFLALPFVITVLATKTYRERFLDSAIAYGTSR